VDAREIGLHLNGAVVPRDGRAAAESLLGKEPSLT
jgi:hypothetical protein